YWSTGFIEKNAELKDKLKYLISEYVLLDCISRNMKLRHYVIIGIFILVNVLIIRTLNFGGKDKKPDETKKVFVPILKAKQVENSEEKFSVTGYGTISSFHRVDIACEVQGKMIKGAKELKPGVKFRKGELIFKVSDTEAQYNLRAKISGFMNIIAQLLPDM